MELDFLWLILTMFIGTYIVLFGLVKRVNEWYHVSRLGERKNSLPPGDMGWPLLGNMWSFYKAFNSNNPDSFIYNLVNRYGRTGMYKTNLFGSPSIIVCIPETCRRVLIDDERFAPAYPSSTRQLSGQKSFHSMPHAEHKRLRRLTTAPINGHEALALYIRHIEETVVSALDEWAGMDRPIELLLETRKVAYEVIAYICLGSSSGSVLGLAEKLYDDLTYGIVSMAINIPGFAFHKALKARKGLVKILQTVLDERRAMNKSNQEKCMMDLMMEIEDEDDRKLCDQDIIDLILMFMLAGHESSAHALMWATLYLYQYPEVLQKAKEEQKEIIKRRPSAQKGLSFNEIRQMEFLSKIIDETLRKANLLFSLFRKAKTDVYINGYLIPKGWKVLVWNRGVHMDPETYFDPKEFLPSRWDQNCNRKAGTFIPFGAGAWICPGADLAKLEIAIFLHYFLLYYKLEQLNPGCPSVYLPTPRPADNCLAKITKLP